MSNHSILFSDGKSYGAGGNQDGIVPCDAPVDFRIKMNKIKLKFFSAENCGQKKRTELLNIKTVAISANRVGLIVNEFENEKTALRIMPYIRRWERAVWDKEKLRYHSKKALKYWSSRKFDDPIHGTIIRRGEDGKRTYEYY